MLVSLGMTLVIATRGIDISVGAVVAISASVAALMVGGQLVITDGVAAHISRFPMWLAIVCALAHGAGLWPVERPAGGQAGSAAHHCHADSDGGWARYCAADHRRADSSRCTTRLTSISAAATCGACRLRCSLRPSSTLLMHWAVTRTALGLFIQAIGINPAAARLAGVRERLDQHLRLRLLRPDGRHRRPHHQLQRQKCRRQQRRQPAGAGRHSGGHAGRHAAHRRALQPGGQHDWRAHHPDADLHHLLHRRAARDQPGGEGRGGVCRHAAAVGRVPPRRARLGGAPHAREVQA